MFHQFGDPNQVNDTFLQNERKKNKVWKGYLEKKFSFTIFWQNDPFIALRP